MSISDPESKDDSELMIPTISGKDDFGRKQPARTCEVPWLSGDSEEEEFRFVHVGVESSDAYISNFVKTSKYDWWSFLFVNLTEQFFKIANFYFLIQCILVCFPEISPFDPSSMIPAFAFILFLSMLGAGRSDYQRHKDDNEVNHRTAMRLGSNGFEPCLWQDLQVGDFLELEAGDPVPADMIILGTQMAGDKVQLGVCYSDTADLDGETNLKIHQALQETQQLLDPAGDPAAQLRGLKGTIKVDHPNSDLYTLQGKLRMDAPFRIGHRTGYSPGPEDNPTQFQKPVLLNNRQVLLRGMRLMNTKKAWGILIYTGAETKVIKNNRNTPELKISKVDRILNFQLIIIFTMLALICCCCAIGAGYWTADEKGDAWYIALADGHGYHESFDENWYGTNSSPMVGFLSWWTWLLVFANFVPISLYVTVEFVKLMLGLMVSWDKEMYVEEKDHAAKCRNNNIIEELGQVEYLLSDKTGTLTCNHMEFFKCSIGGTMYGVGITEIEIAMMERWQSAKEHAEEQLAQLLAIKTPEQEERSPLLKARRGQSTEEQLTYYIKRLEGLIRAKQEEKGCTSLEEVQQLRSKHPAFYDPAVSDKRWLQDQDSPSAAMMRSFFEALAFCHHAMPEVEGEQVTFSGPSPDDVALLNGCRDAGFSLLENRIGSGTSSDLLLRVGDGTPQYHKMEIEIEFSSKRKRMSVVIRQPGGRLVVFMKGADSFVFDRLAADVKTAPETVTTQAHADRFATEGLRVMFVASKEINETFFARWREDYLEVKEMLLGAGHSGPELQEAEAKCEALEEELEGGMTTLLGVTAIEDQLQENVGRKLRALQDAHIKVWVLTGDKVGTAMMIGLACELLQESMYNIVIEGEAEVGVTFTAEQVLAQLKKEKALAEEELAAKAEEAKPERHAGGLDEGEMEGQIALVIDGKALTALGIGVVDPPLHSREQQREFIQLAQDCAAVLCCRVSPSQKGELIQLVKTTLNKVTLGVGDGANDVPMIQRGDIGVGVQGVEGSQAVNNADFAIGQFQHLRNLLLVHGRWAYFRIGNAVCYFFYKNIAQVFTVMWYAVVTGFSGTLQYSDQILCHYNLLYTSIPVIIYALFERDISYEDSVELPSLYTLGPANRLLTTFRFFMWVAEAFYAATCIFALPYMAISLAPSGHTLPLAFTGLTMFTVNIVVVTVRLSIITLSWTCYHFIFYIGSVVLWFAFQLIEFALPNGLFTSGMYWDSYNLWSTAFFWLCVPLASWVAILPAFVYKCYKDCFDPYEHLSGSWRLVEERKASRKRAANQHVAEDLVPKTPHEFVRRKTQIDRIKNEVGTSEGYGDVERGVAFLQGKGKLKRAVDKLSAMRTLGRTDSDDSGRK